MIPHVHLDWQMSFQAPIYRSAEFPDPPEDARGEKTSDGLMVQELD